MISEALIFAGLFAAHAATAPEPALRDAVLAIVIAGALVVASIVMTSAIRQVRADRLVPALRRLEAAIVVGTLAVALELLAASQVSLRDPLGLVLIGLHAAHVAAAVALAAWATALSRGGGNQHGRCMVLELVGQYWYFVAALWVFVGPLLTT